MRNLTAYKPIYIGNEQKLLFVYKDIAGDFKRELEDIVVVAKLLGYFNMAYIDNTNEKHPNHIFRFGNGEHMSHLMLDVGTSRKSSRVLNEVTIQTTNYELKHKWRETAEKYDLRKCTDGAHGFYGQDESSMMEVLKVFKLSL